MANVHAQTPHHSLGTRSTDQARSVERRWIILALACTANFVAILDLWVVGIAYPAFERAFAGAPMAALSWILNVYAIVLSSLLIPAGRIADGLGIKRSFVAGLALFGVASWSGARCRARRRRC